MAQLTEPLREAVSGHSTHLHLLPSLTPLRTLHKHETLFVQGSRHAAPH